MKRFFNKKGYLWLGAILLIAGIAVGTGGFALAHFDVRELPQTAQRPWYQTIVWNGESLWFGVEFPGGAVSSGDIPMES